MPKPMIETSVLLKLIKKYFEDECHNNIKRLRYSEITQYINRNGYPNYPATSLRRNKAAVDYITELRQTVSEVTGTLSCISGISRMMEYSTLIGNK